LELKRELRVDELTFHRGDVVDAERNESVPQYVRRHVRSETSVRYCVRRCLLDYLHFDAEA